MDGWKTTLLLGGIFSGAMLNFRGGILRHPFRPRSSGWDFNVTDGTTLF